MPHVALKLIPGVDTIKTEALNEAAISESNLIRYMPERNSIGLPQKLGGWIRFPAPPENQVPTLNYDVKALHAWADSDSNNHLGIGTTGSLEVYSDGEKMDISPSFYEIDVPVDFSTINKSSEVDIGDPGSNVQDTDDVFVMTHVAVGGLVMFGMYPCIAQTSDIFSVTARNVIGTPIKATSTDSPGLVAEFITTIDVPGIEVVLANHGYEEGNSYPLLVPVTVGGVTLEVGNYRVVRVIGDNRFMIMGRAVPTSTDSEFINGGKVRLRYYIGPLIPNASGSSGYGNGGYGRGGYGSGVTTTIGRTLTVTAGSFVGQVVTLTHTGDFAIPVGSLIDVAGMTPSIYNVSGKTVTASTLTTVSYNVGATPSGPATVFGEITIRDYFFEPVEDWTLDNMGDNLIACPEGGAIYSWSIYDGGSKSEAAIINNCPSKSIGALVAMPQRQVIAYGSTFNDIIDPLLIRWNDINDIDDWLANATNQAGSYRLPNGSFIVGALQGNAQILVWTDLGVWSMQYVSLPLVYSFNEIGRGCGLIGKKAAASGFGSVYWMSQTQFWQMAGGGLQPIPCPIWDRVFTRLDRSAAANIRCGINARFGEVWWFYPTLRENGSAGDGVPRDYVKYNTLIGQWDYGELDRTAWIDQNVFGPPIAAGSDRKIYQHEVGYDADGKAMKSSFQTGYFTLSEGNELTFLDQLWPDMKWSDDLNRIDTSDVQIKFFVAEYPGEKPREYGPFTVTKATKFITPRFRGRLVSIRVSSDSVGTFWRLGNIRYRINPDGRFL